jgi:hypothetical protein
MNAKFTFNHRAELLNDVPVSIRNNRAKIRYRVTHGGLVISE